MLDTLEPQTKVQTKPTPEQLVQRARDLAPLLRENDALAEELRQLPKAVVDACAEAGFFKICQPAAYEGYEYEPLVLYEVVIELARASAAVGWAISIVAIHNWEVGLCDPAVARDIWGEDPNARLSSSYAPFGKATKVEGGYVVNGRWPWSSGSDHCQWVILGTRHLNPESPIGFDERAMIIPRSDYEVDQSSWHMAGMKGTGSKDIVVRDAFVPSYRNHCMTDSFFKKTAPGSAPFTGQTYRYPFGIVFGTTLSSAVIGAAQGALDTYVDYLSKKKHAFTGEVFKDDPFNQKRLAEASAVIYSARSVLARDFGEMKESLRGGGDIPMERRAAYKWNLAYHARCCANAVATLMEAAGGSGFALSNSMQRFFRDTQTAKNHAFLNTDKSGSMYGWYLFTGEQLDFLA